MQDNRGTLAIKIRGVPFAIEFADWTHDRLYHTVEWTGGDTQTLQAFIGGIGSVIPGGSRSLTNVDTNIPRSGDTGLQEGWEMLIYSIQVEVVREMMTSQAGGVFAMQDTGAVQLSRPTHVGGYEPAALPAGGVLFDFMRKVFHRFQVNQKVQSEGSIEKYPQGSGPTVFTTNTSVEVASNGVASPRDQSAFVLPIWLRPNIGYVAQLAPAAALGIAGVLAGTVNGYADWSAGTIGTPTASGFDMKETLEGLLRRPVT